MNAIRRLILPITVVGVLLSIAFSAFAQSDNPVAVDQIVIDNADTVRELTPESNSGLGALLNAVSPRLAIEYANHVRELVPGAPSSSLHSLLSAAASRLVTEYANHMREISTANVPSTFDSLLKGVSPRAVVEFANHTRHLDTSFPKAIINDTKAPVITGFNTNGVRIFWTTDEFASSNVQIGLKSETYTQTFDDALFRTDHELALPPEIVAAIAAAESAGDPNAATLYYVRIASTDLSGNRGISREYTAQSSEFFYLPLLNR